MKPNNRPVESAPRVYTDAPARCIQLPGGFLDFDTSCNVIVQRETTNLCLGTAETRLSIRCAFNGERRFEVDGHHYVIDDNTYLLLNLGQTASSDLYATVPVECLNVTFKPEFVDEVFRSMITPEDRLLDSPGGISCQPLSFFAKTYPHDDILSPHLFRLRSALPTQPLSRLWLEEQFHLLAVSLLQVHRNVLGEVDKLPASRPATRLERYQRLHRAKDFMRAGLHQPLTLADIAGSACLAPHHFLRQFKQAFHQTPHQYLTQLRLDRAQSLLRSTDLSVTTICMEVGFDSLGSFSWLFHRRFGLPPTSYRADSILSSRHAKT